MKIKEKNPPRTFRTGNAGQIIIRDCAEIWLEPDELVTFVTPEGKRFDFSRKDWGYYATPSINSRLKNEGFRTALVRNTIGRYFVMVIDMGKISLFQQYCRDEQQTIVQWLDELSADEMGSS